MAQKPLLVLTPTKRDLFHPVLRALATLGIPAHHGTLTGTGSTSLQTPLGTMNPSNARTLFQQNYAAIFVLERRGLSETSGDTRTALETWLTWNTPDDPPVVLFGPNLSTARTLTLPSDFPIVRPDPANLDATAVLMDASIFLSGGTPGGGSPFPKLGGAVFLTREQTTVYTPVTCAFQHTSPNNTYFWRLDETQHNALGADGEILAIPNFPDKTFPTSPPTIAAYRYKKHYLLPLLVPQPADRVHTETLVRHGNMEFFWLLYALKLLGIPPARQAVLCFEIDHALASRTNRPDLTEAQQFQILEGTYQYLAQFSQETNAVFGCWIQPGGRSRGYASTEWYFLYNHPDPAIRAATDRILNLLRAHHHAGLPTGIHDHSADPSKHNFAFRRIGDNRHPYAAPNDVPIQPGTLILKRLMPNPPNNARDYGDYWDLGPTQMSGTLIDIATFPNDNLYAARANLADQWDEALALGFPDGHAGRHRYVGYANNLTGGTGWWDAWRELGFRGLRINGLSATEWDNRPRRQTHPPNYRYKDLWFVPGFHWDWMPATENASSYGLYSPTSPNNITQYWNLDANNDITGSYTTSAATRWKAYRRAIALGVGIWLRAALYSRGTMYLHPPSWFGADPNNPTGITDTGSDLKINPMVELTTAMRTIVSVLSDYLRFGGPAEVMDLLDQIGVV